MSKRLEKLEALVRSGNAAPFVHYGLAMEYRSAERATDAIRVFTELRAAHPEYLPMYLLCGQLLADEARADEARDWLEHGLALARSQGDAKAASELAGALDTLD